MRKMRPQQDRMFSPRPMVALRDKLSRLDIASAAEVAGLEPFMEATISAAMIIAHADGKAERAERQRILSLFRHHPYLNAFSPSDIAREIALHDEALERDEPSALAAARRRIFAAELTATQFRTLMSICLSVMEADGVKHPEEAAALAAISAMHPWEQR